MDLPVFTQTVERLKLKIAQFQGRAIGEESTKMTLISPMLRALDWDTEDLEDVECEYRFRKGYNPVDYALMSLRAPKLFVEAKPLGGNLKDIKWVGQALNYATMAAVEWVVLTDGNEYHLYNALAPVLPAAKLLSRIRLSDATPAEIGMLQYISKDRLALNELEAIWQTQFVDQQVKETLEAMFTADPTQDPVLANLIAKRCEKVVKKDIRASLARLRVSFDFPTLASSRVIEPKLLVITPASPSSKPKRTRVTFHVKLSEVAALIAQTPLELEQTWHDIRTTATLEKDGKLWVQGTSFRNPSAAGAYACDLILGQGKGHAPQPDGWHFWTFMDEAGEMKPLDFLRQQLILSKKPAVEGLDPTSEPPAAAVREQE